MKKIIIICIVGILLSTAFGAVAVTNSDQKEDNQNQGSRATHTVLGEQGTATWCGYCQYACGALKQLWDEGALDFNYVAFVSDKNSVAASYLSSHFNLYGYPTLWWDGGYKVNVGAGSIPSAKAAYTTSINQCAARPVKDVDISLSAEWLGSTEIGISCSITNNEATTYNGTIRVYIMEKVSSMGWYDSAGLLYEHPFLDFAFNEAVSIPASDTWSDSTNWIGSAHGYTTITENNMMIVAAVENDEWHQGYSYPPSSNPFDAYYVDDAVTFTFGSGPNTPYSPSPANGATNVDINADLSWKGGPGTTINYDVYFGTTNPPSLVTHNQSALTYNPGTMDYSTQYYWKIVAWDQDQNYAAGPVWSFTTLTNPNDPPDKPTITGPAKGAPGNTYKYTITGTDPDQDMVSAYIMWGDDTITDWTAFHDSGESFSVTHSWAEKGTYTVQVKLKDSHGAESEWATLDVQMPKSFEINNPFVQWFFQHFPNAFPLLRQLLGV